MSLGYALYDQVLTGSPLCDVTICAGNTEIRAHWCVLVTCPYFSALYNSQLLERQTGYAKLSVSETGLRDALKFLYLNDCNVTADNVGALLTVGDYLQMSALVRRCGDFINEVEITLDNCLTVCSLAGEHDFEETYRNAFSFIAEHAAEVVTSDSALDLNIDSIKAILNIPENEKISNDILFWFVVRWVERDSESRLESFPLLFAQLSLDLFSPDTFYNTVKPHKLVNAFPACAEKVADVDAMVIDGLLKLEPDFKTVFITVGTDKRHAGVGYKTMLIYDQYTDAWINLPSPILGSCHKKLMTACDNVVYVTGESLLDKNNSYVRVETYDISRNKWIKISFKIPYYVNDCGLKIKFIHVLGSTLYVGGEYGVISGNRVKFALFSYRLDGDYGSMLKECDLSIGQGYLDVLKLARFSDKYLCILATKSDVAEPTLVVFKYDLYSGEVDVINSDSTLPSQALVYVKDDEFLIASLGGTGRHAWSAGDRRWRRYYSSNIPQLPEPFSKRDSATNCLFYQDCLYVFASSSRDNRGVRVYKLAPGDSYWTGDAYPSLSDLNPSDIVSVNVNSYCVRRIKAVCNTRNADVTRLDTIRQGGLKTTNHESVEEAFP